MEDKLQRVRELNRTVQPRVAAELMNQIIVSSTHSDLQQYRSLIESTIAGFHPKRRRILSETLVEKVDSPAQSSDQLVGIAESPPQPNDDQVVVEKSQTSAPRPPVNAIAQPRPSAAASPPIRAKWSSDGHSERSDAQYRADRIRQRKRQAHAAQQPIGARKTKFTDVKFGLISAEAERRKSPNLLLQGFFERFGVIDGLINGSEYLVLGYKGSGKSSIAEHIGLESKERSDLFVESLLLRDFPYDQVPEIVKGDADWSVRTNLAWSLLLLLKIFESLTKDQAVSFQDGGTQFDDLTKQLRALGLLPKRKFRDLVLVSREVNLSVELAKIFKGGVVGQYKEPVVVLSHIRDALKVIIRDAVTPNRHMIIIDGLDEVFTLFSSWFETIASLVHQVDSLNAEFHEANSAPKVVLLCRADIFERLPSPNVNKLRDYAYVLDWYHDPQDAEDSDLFELAHHRAKLSGYLGPNVITDALPDWLYQDRPKPVDTYKFLLDHTRHTPRDFLQLLQYIQGAARNRELVSSSNILGGLRAYSTGYFLPELRDELSGYFNPRQIEACFSIIGGLRKRTFSMKSLKQHYAKSEMGSGLDLDEAVRVLFDCSAIGNFTTRPRGDDEEGGVYYTFRFRNRNASVNYGEGLVLHRGAWKGFNIV